MAQSIGVSVGANFDRLSNIRLNDKAATFSSKNGWHVEVWIEFPLGLLGMRPGVRYMDAGMLFEGLSDHTANVRDNFDITLVEIPLLFRYSIGISAIQPTLFAGPVGRFTVAVDNIIENDLRSPSLAGEAGIGVEISLGKLRIIPEVAYTWGITNFIDDELLLEFVSLSVDEKQTLNSAMLRVAVAF